MNITDIHAHIIPDVDDGARDDAMAVSMLKKAAKAGVSNIILTPHYNEYRDYTADCKKKFEELKELSLSRDLGINLYLGREIRYSSNICDLLCSHSIETMADSKYILLEFSSISDYEFIRRGVNELVMRGYSPIIAHIERYPALYRCKFDELDNLREAGALFQINGMGLYDSRYEMKRFCKKLIKYDILDFVASDCHNTEDRTIDIDQSFRYIEKHYGNEYAVRIFEKNPQIILDK